MNTRELTIQYLKTLQEQGIHKLALNDEGRSVLRAWMLAAREKKQLVTQSSVPLSQQDEATSTPSTLEAPQDGNTPIKGEIRFTLPDEKTKGEPPAAEEPEELELARFGVPEGALEERWQAFEYLLRHWEPIAKFCKLRETLVLGQGDKQANIMFIGDAPNATDEKTGIPFSAEAGEKLNGILKAMELTREQIYLTHLVKYRPAMPRQLTNNRPPSATEIKLFSHVLRSEVELVKPRVIVALGVIAARGILGLGELPLAEYQSKPRFIDGTPVIVTHHPSYLLRTTDMAERRLLWESMLKCLSLAGHQITEKQQSYFLPKGAANGG